MKVINVPRVTKGGSGNFLRTLIYLFPKDICEKKQNPALAGA
jgi:hypothetical protein